MILIALDNHIVVLDYFILMLFCFIYRKLTQCHLFLEFLMFRVSELLRILLAIVEMLKLPLQNHIQGKHMSTQLQVFRDIPCLHNHTNLDSSLSFTPLIFFCGVKSAWFCSHQIFSNELITDVCREVSELQQFLSQIRPTFFLF